MRALAVAPTVDLARPDLLERCRLGERAAWDELYREHADRVWRFAARLGVAPSDLPDVLQDAFVVVFRRIEDFDAERGPFSTWVFGITLNVVRSHRKRSLRARLREWMGLAGTAAETVGDDPEHALERSDALREVQWVLE